MREGGRCESEVGDVLRCQTGYDGEAELVGQAAKDVGRSLRWCWGPSVRKGTGVSTVERIVQVEGWGQ